jgi:hypothetical protein
MIGLGASLGACALRLVSLFSTGPVTSVVEVTIFSVGVCLLILAVTLAVYDRSTRREAARLGVVWSRRCLLPDTQEMWRMLVVDSAGIRVISLRGRAKHAWPWASVLDADLESVTPPGSLVSHTGVVVTLAEGGRVPILLPSASTFRYPLATAEDAVQRIRTGKAASASATQRLSPRTPER